MLPVLSSGQTAQHIPHTAAALGHCDFLLLAGGGIARGRVYGASDRLAAEPVGDPVGPGDLMATVYHLLGIGHRQLTDLSERPLPLVEGAVVRGLLS